MFPLNEAGLLRRFLPFKMLAFFVGVVLANVVACVPEQPAAKTGYVTISVEQKASWTRNFNPLVASGGARWPSQGGIYEPMMVFNTVQNQWVPWLATSYAWSEDGLSLSFVIRKNVRWSDGKPFAAQDVVATFELMKAFPALDAGGAWKFLNDVSLRADDEVVFKLNKKYVPGLHIVAQQPVVPRHIWSNVKDPVAFANPNPVATGPFTEVERFENQIYVLGLNPYYWQKEKIGIQGLRFPAYPGNEQANLALINGEIDWAGNFVPAIDRIYVAKDPEHHHYWFPRIGTTVFLYVDVNKAPFSNVEVRRALSQAIDRELMVKVAMFGYTEPAYPTGLADNLDAWRAPKVAAQMDWMTHSQNKALARLEKEGWARNAEGELTHPDHGALEMEIIVVSGWSDWVRACQVVAQNLKSIGVKAKVRTYDFGTWFEKMQKGEFQAGIGWSTDGASPYSFYKWLMSPDTVVAKPKMASSNWHRFGVDEVKPPLNVLETEPDLEKQKAAGVELQRLFAQHFPAIPLFTNPAWGAFNSKRFRGFPSQEHPYARLSPNGLPGALLVLTQLTQAPSGAEQP